MSQVITLAEGKLYALANPYELNGYVSTHSPKAEGFAPYQSYLAIDGGHALLIDSGMSAHGESLIAQLKSLIEPGTPLTLFPLRIGEFASVCNVRPLAEEFGLTRMYGIVEGATTWGDFRPDYAPFGTEVGGGALAEVETPICKTGEPVSVGPDGARTLLSMNPPIRLLPSHWLYDEATHTLFTADAFNHVWRDTADGPWIVASDEEPPAVEQVYDFMVTSRYWWLPGADTRRLRTDIRNVFETYNVDVIAPSFGCVLSGRDVVERHVEILDQVLEIAGGEESIGVTVGRGSMGKVNACQTR
jgi:hypothetical protein